MKQLQQLLKQFLAREIGLEELQRRFALALAEEPGLAGKAAAWLDAGEKDGLLSSTVCTSLKNVLVTYLASSAGGSTLSQSGIFDTLYESDVADAGARSGEHGRSRSEGTSRVTVLRQTQLRHTARGTVAGPDDATRMGQGAQAGASTGALTINSIISDRFILIERLGSGGMGSVYKARDRLRDEAQDRNPFVALKVLSEEFKAHPDSIIALQREARRAQTLAHPNVITVHDFGRDGPHVYISMEHLEGRSLDLLVQTDYAGGLPLSKAWPIIEGMGRALEYGHKKGIIHSDVKPGNVFVCNDGSVKVLDFGISRPMQLAGAPISEKTAFDPGTRLGGLTPSYAALEMWARATPDPRDDIYALACVSYLLLTGRHPFAGRPATEAVHEGMEPPRIESLSRGQWNAIANGLAFKREDRLPSVTRFLDELSPSSVVRSRRRYAAMAVLLVASLAAAFGVRYYGGTIEGRVLDNQGRMQRGAVAQPAERPELSREQQEAIDSWLQLADLNLADVTLASGPEDLSYLLSDGPNAVKQLYESILEYDPWYPEALALREKVLNLYTEKAQQLMNAGDESGAMEMVRRGTDIDPGSRALYRLQLAICANDAALCTAR
jgi:serine/threonine protein kinase